MLVLYARSRRLPATFALLLLTFAGMWAIRSEAVVGFEKWSYELSYPAVVFGPLIMATAITASLYDPFGELGPSLSCSAWRFRSALLVVGLFVSFIQILVTFGTHSPNWTTGARNLLAFTGAACFGSLLLDARLAWMPLTVAILACYTASAATTLDGAHVPEVLWQWPVLPVGYDLTLAIAVLLTLGIPVVCIKGPVTRKSF